MDMVELITLLGLAGDMVLTEEERAKLAEQLLSANMGELANLQTTAKGNLVAAINEVLAGGGGGGGADPEPHNYTTDGRNLKDFFTDADALHTALAAGNFAHIHIGDYWPLTLSGTFRDYGTYVALAGTTYYSDTACTEEAGTFASNTDMSFDGYPEYCYVKVDGVNVYVPLDNVQKYKVVTLNNQQMYYEVAEGNPYWRYGDSGNGIADNHLLLIPRDGIGVTLKMRPSSYWFENSVIEEFTATGPTATITMEDTTRALRWLTVNGELKTYNTHYTVSKGVITPKAAAGIVAGDTIRVCSTPDDHIWEHNALYRTLNDPDYGIIKLIEQADPKLASHIYAGPNDNGMRYYAEHLTVAGSGSGAWKDRGKLFLPLESEVWGTTLYSAVKDNATFRPQLSIFRGSQRRRSKGVSNGSGRAGWWVGSVYSATSWCYVYSIGYASIYYAYIASAVAPGFLVI